MVDEQRPPTEQEADPIIERVDVLEREVAELKRQLGGTGVADDTPTRIDRDFDTSG